MLAKEYDWKRYWLPREAEFVFDSQGFLSPPSGNLAWVSGEKNDAVVFDNLVTAPCLILLGEPGIGKSRAFLDAGQHVAQTRKSAIVLSVDLGEYGDENRLIDDVFASAEFLSWSKNKTELHLFLDSFDECLLRLDTVAGILARQLSGLQTVGKFFFRIASRTAEWRPSLEDAIKRKWGEDKVSAFVMAPLTKEQVFSAARMNVTNPDKFIREVVDREVVPFAMKPLTLELLFRVWNAGNNSLPLTQREIYDKGCLELCSESNPARDTPRLRRKLDPEQCLGIAGQISTSRGRSSRSFSSFAKSTGSFLGPF